MSNQQRMPMDITTIMPAGQKFLIYCRDGSSRLWGRWSATVQALDLDEEEITLELSQDWEGADTRGGQYWRETRIIKFDDFLMPVGMPIGGEFMIL